MEALSMEDNGNGIRFNVFCYNAELGIEIDYALGRSRIAAEDKTEESEEMEQQSNNTSPQTEATYIGNKNSMKFHYPDCDSVSEIKEKNKVYMYGSREESLEKGYQSHGKCRP